MASAIDQKNSKILKSFQEDLEIYRDRLGKTTNEVLATKSLDFSIRYKKLWEKEAPTKEDIDREARERGYRTIVRKRIRDKFERDESGKKNRRRKFKRTHLGVVHTSKNSYLISKELAVRRSSVKWLKRTVPTWAKRENKNISEGSKFFASSKTKTKKTVGTTKGNFSAKKDSIIVSNKSFGIESADKLKLNLHEKALEQSQKDTRKFLNEKTGRDFGKSIKKLYR